jgi:hypothetical protein
MSSNTIEVKLNKCSVKSKPSTMTLNCDMVKLLVTCDSNPKSAPAGVLIKFDRRSENGHYHDIIIV